MALLQSYQLALAITTTVPVRPEWTARVDAFLSQAITPKEKLLLFANLTGFIVQQYDSNRCHITRPSPTSKVPPKGTLRIGAYTPPRILNTTTPWHYLELGDASDWHVALRFLSPTQRLDWVLDSPGVFETILHATLHDHSRVMLKKEKERFREDIRGILARNKIGPLTKKVLKHFT